MSKPALPPRQLWRRFGSLALDLLYPPICQGCDKSVLIRDDHHHLPPLCPDCELRLAPLLPPFCDRCGRSFDGKHQISDPIVCPNCSGRHLHFDQARAPYTARGMVREMIHAFKYGQRLPLRKPLAQLLNRLLDEETFSGERWILVPVPLHPRRRRTRGFNQSEEIARLLSNWRGFPLVHALQRTRFTPPQSRLSRAERLANLQEAIAPDPEHIKHIDGRAVLLVDDVFTTGATSEACSGVLKKSGARKVLVITVARG